MCQVGLLYITNACKKSDKCPNRKCVSPWCVQFLTEAAHWVAGTLSRKPHSQVIRFVHTCREGSSLMFKSDNNISPNINTLFKFMSNRPVVVQNECHPYLPAREVRSICKENEIVFQVYIMSHILIHLFSHARLNPKCYFLGLFLVSRLTPALVPAFSLSWRILR